MLPKLLLVTVTLFATMMGLSTAQGRCENEADPQEGIGNFCYCEDGTCHAHSRDPKTAYETCNPPGVEIPCP
ncbi:hypothetical protein N656DRAFT_793621 [Canariomyces notabilis]|uniref:Uncharacterized protein n=1 Tax=Canariomyces notabilis TaxID=2074819 RepID=A0AAN6YWX4_9PEZI|nr:hypothetical protein N656DRAFT_793621 [Canariomyces arenarius]